MKQLSNGHLFLPQLANIISLTGGGEILKQDKQDTKYSNDESNCHISGRKDSSPYWTNCWL